MRVEEACIFARPDPIFYSGFQGAAYDTDELKEASLANTPLDPSHPEMGTRLANMPDIDAYNDKRWSLSNAIYLSGFLLGDRDNNQKAALHEFLSLYALTQVDTAAGNGTWTHLPVKNGEAVRAALFGSGAKIGGLISGVHIGDGNRNSYKDIREILDRLGIYATPEDDHQHHFHIYLNPPDPLESGPSLLLSGNPLAMSPDTASGTVALAATTQALFDYTQTLITGDELMFTMDVPYVPPQDAPIVLAQATNTSSPPDYLLKTCDEVPTAGGAVTAMNLVNPAAWLVGELKRPQNGPQVLTQSQLMALVASVKLTQLQGVTHGQLIPHSADGTSDGRVVYEYRSEPGYVGKDQAIFMAEFEGKRYKIIANVVVSMTINENDPQCPAPQLIKVTKPSTGDSGYGTGYNLASVSVNFADLPGGAVGQAVGNTITLDTNAAGHNWFIDTTPADNSEYLPTSNPYEWLAKEGTAAYGKMDMLSVLLHEYGHALGIEHSADNHDYMATTLTPGVRRMPSAEELALMQELIAQAKGEMVEGVTGSPPTPALPLQGGGGQDVPLPIPLGAGFGLAFLGRLRSSRYGGMSIAPDYSTFVTQYAVAANATFTNLNTAGGWNTQGSVDIAPSTGSQETAF